MKKYICIDIGGTRIKYGAVDENGILVRAEDTATEAVLGGRAVLDKVCSLTEQLVVQEEDVYGICVSTAGMVDCRQGLILYASELIPGYTGMNVKEWLEKRFGLPCEVENDVNCAGLAESRAGASKGSRISLCLTVGTGIGGALVMDGKVFHGFCGSACEIGYMYMGESAFQDLGSASALVKLAAARKGIDPGIVDGRWVFDMAEHQDTDCIAAIDQLTDVLGMGIANLCYMLNPEVVVLGGGIMERKEYLYPKIRKRMDRYLLPFISSKTRLAFAELGNTAGMLGAYYHFTDRQKERNMDGGL